jgi:hypothetical protein
VDVAPNLRLRFDSRPLRLQRLQFFKQARKLAMAAAVAQLSSDVVQQFLAPAPLAPSPAPSSQAARKPPWAQRTMKLPHHGLRQLFSLSKAPQAEFCCFIFSCFRFRPPRHPLRLGLQLALRLRPRPLMRLPRLQTHHGCLRRLRCFQLSFLSLRSKIFSHSSEVILDTPRRDPKGDAIRNELFK